MFLKNIGVLGFDPLEKVILAALVTEEPILIIGRPGTDKANLLVYISQALGLSFKKVNAAMTSKLEITGMPVVKDNDDKITFISAPYSVWKKQALVFDLLNEAKPICMSVISSILFEKQINGYPMETLQYRWATMENTDLFNSDMTAFKRRNIYLEEELVENFAFIIEAPTWDNFSVEEKLEGFISGFTHPVKELNNELIAFISKLKPLYEEQLLFPKPKLAAYACLVTSLLNEGGVYVSVQRSLQLLRNLVALDLVHEHWNGEENKDKMGDTLDFKTGLYLSEYKQLRKQLRLIQSGVVQNTALVDSVMKNLNDFEHDLKNNTLDKSVNLEGAMAAEKMQVNALYQGSLNLPKLFIESRASYDTLSPKVNAFVDQLSTKMNLKK